MTELTDKQREILQRARKKVATQTANQRGGEFGQSIAGGLVDAFTSGVTFGHTDEIEGGKAALLGQTLDGDWFDYSQPFSERYRAARDFKRGQMGAFSNAHPGTALTAEIAGALSPLGRVAQMGQLGWKGLTGLGAAGGALAGLGNAPELEDALEEMGVGGAIGAATGLASIPLSYIPKKGVESIRGWMENLPSGYRKAARELVAGMRKEGKDSDQIMRELQAAEKTGSPYTIADTLGVEGRNMTALAGEGGEEGSRAMRQFLQDRQNAQHARITGTLKKDFGPAPVKGVTPTAAMAQDSVGEMRRKTSKVYYDEAMRLAKPVDAKNLLKTIKEIKGTSITPKLAKRFKYYTAALSSKEAKGDNFEFVLRLKDELSDEIGKAKKSDELKVVRVLSQLKDTFDKALDTASPSYRKANDTYSAQSAVLDTFKKGQQATKNTIRAGDVKNELGKLSSAPAPDINLSQQQAYQQGAGDRLLQKVESARPTTNAAAPYTTDIMKNKVRTLSTRPQQTLDTMARENTMYDTYRAGVPKAPGQQGAQAGLSGRRAPTTITGVIGEGTDAAARAASRKWQGNIQGQLAEMLMARGATAEQAIARAEQLLADDEALKRLLASGVLATGQAAITDPNAGATP